MSALQFLLEAALIRSDDISWSKPISYDGIKKIYPIICNAGLSDSNLGLGIGIRIDQRGKDAWQIKLLYAGFDENGHYICRSDFIGEPGPLRQIKANVVDMMTDSNRLSKLLSELKKRQKEIKNNNHPDLAAWARSEKEIFGVDPIQRFKC